MACGMQALVTREGPVEGLMNHIANPFGHNILTNVYNINKFVTSSG